MPTPCFSQSPDPQTLQQKLATLRGTRRAPLSTKKKHARQHLAPVTPASSNALLLLAGLVDVADWSDNSAPPSKASGTPARRSDLISSNNKTHSWRSSNNNGEADAIDPVLLRLDAGLSFERRSSSHQRAEPTSARSASIGDEPQQCEDGRVAHGNSLDGELASSRQHAGHIRALRSLKHRRHVRARDSCPSSFQHDRKCYDDNNDQHAAHEPCARSPPGAVDLNFMHGTTLARFRRLVGTVARKSLAQMTALAAERVALHRKRSRCASRIQKAVRGFLRRLNEQRKQRKQRAMASAVAIQCAWRSAVARADAAGLRRSALVYRIAVQQAEALRMKRAAASIQRGYRAYWMRKSLALVTATTRENALRSCVARWQRARRRRRTQQQRLDLSNDLTDTRSTAPKESGRAMPEMQHPPSDADLLQARSEEPGWTSPRAPNAVSSRSPPLVEGVRSSASPFDGYIQTQTAHPNVLGSESERSGADESKPPSARLQQRCEEQSLPDSESFLEKELANDALSATQCFRHGHAVSGQMGAITRACRSFSSRLATPASSGDDWVGPTNTDTESGDRDSVGDRDTADEGESCGGGSPVIVTADSNQPTDDVRSPAPCLHEWVVSVTHRNSVVAAQRVLGRFALVYRAHVQERRGRRDKELRAMGNAAAVRIQCQIRRRIASRCVRRTRQQTIRELRAELAAWSSDMTERVILDDRTSESEESEEEDGGDESDEGDTAATAPDHSSSWSCTFGGRESTQFQPTRNGQVPPGVPVEQLQSAGSRLWKWSWDAELWMN